MLWNKTAQYYVLVMWLSLYLFPHLYSQHCITPFKTACTKDCIMCYWSLFLLKWGIWEKLACDINFVFPRSIVWVITLKFPTPTLTKCVIYFAFFTFLLYPLTGILLVSENARHGGGWKRHGLKESAQLSRVCL